MVFIGQLMVGVLYAQSSSVTGTVLDDNYKVPITGATVQVQGAENSTVTDEEGKFTINNLEPGYVNLEIKMLGYETYIIYETQVFANKSVEVEAFLKEGVIDLEEIIIKPSLFRKPIESPNSIKSLGVTEIKRAPGSGQDISRVIQTLPGVASAPASNRNDIIVRGGGPTENTFFVDDFEINSINHFSTQGASGGVWGIIDANYLNSFDLNTGAFPLYADNALSSVFNLKLRKGNTEKLEGQLNLGVLTRGVNLAGPIGKKTTFLMGARQANFDLIFPNRPIVPKFTDAMTKVTFDISDKSKLELLGVAAIDNLNYNTDVEMNDENFHILERVRKIKQNTYTLGAKWTQLWDFGNTKFIYSHNNFNNDVTKFKDNDERKQQILDYQSSEVSHRLEIRNEFFINNYKLNFGANYKNSNYDVENKSFQVNNSGVTPILFENTVGLNHYGMYANLSNSYLDNKLKISAGFRLDANDYSDEFSNPLEQFSPRIALSYALNNKTTLSASAGRYFQTPSLTSLGFVKNNLLINKENNIKPIQNTQYVLGAEYNTNFNSSLSIEGFYKNYKNYPFSVDDSISLANKGAGFGVFGDEELVSNSQGRSYGVELFYQQKLFKDFYGMFSYTWVKSEFDNNDDKYTPSSWDYGNILSVTLGKRFKNNWEIGTKWVYYGGIPYTPYNQTTSALVSNWDLNNQGLLDYTQLNSLRTNAYHQLDIRIDKKFYFKKWNLNLYADFQNLYNYIGGIAPQLILDRDENNQPQTQAGNPNAYLLKYEELKGYGIRPNIGLIVEF